MRLTAITTVLLAATLTERAEAGDHCGNRLATLFIRFYKAGSSSPVPNIPGVCGGLWDNLKRYPECIGVSAPNCYGDRNGYLNWEFNNGSGCQAQMVEGAWWYATQNQWGAIHCNQD